MAKLQQPHQIYKHSNTEFELNYGTTSIWVDATVNVEVENCEAATDRGTQVWKENHATAEIEKATFVTDNSEAKLRMTEDQNDQICNWIELLAETGNFSLTFKKSA